MSSLKELITKNRSYRGYNEARKVSREELLDMVDCARLSASSQNIQPMKYYLANEKEEVEAIEPSVIIVRRPCALLKYVKHNPPLSVDPDKCKGCRSCMKIGCPAIRFSDKKASIDATICVGCGLCEQMCRFGAFEHKEVR